MVLKVCVFCCIGIAACAQELPQLKALEEAYREALQKTGAPFGKLDTQYRAELEKLAAHAKSQGDLEMLLAIKAELAAPGASDIPASEPEVKQLRGIYERKKAQLEQQVAGARAAVAKAYRARLAALLKQFIQADQLDHALAVKAVMDGVEVPEVPPAGKPAGKPAKTIDVIALLDLQRDVQHGKWEKRDGELHGLTTHIVPRFQIPYRPPEEYDIEICWTQPKIRHELWIKVIIDGKPICLHYGQGYAGFGFIDGLKWKHPDSPSRVELPPLEPDRKYTMKIEVRKKLLKGYIDGELKTQLSVEPERWTADRWKRMRDPTLPAIGCDDPVVFHTIRLTPVSGPGKPLETE